MKFLPLLVLAVTTLSAHAAPPVVSNVRASQRAGTHTVDIYYNVTSANSPLTVYVAISADAGTTWNVPVFTVQGAVGPGVTPGSDRHIQWNVGTDWPVQTVNWYDAVKWCNARSEKAGLTPCYYTSAGQTTVYRTSQITLSNSFVKWTASGYRLPTEAEWEKAYPPETAHDPDLLRKAELEREWIALPTVKAGDQDYEAKLPAEAVVWFALVSDDRPVTVSGDLISVKEQP